MHTEAVETQALEFQPAKPLTPAEQLLAERERLVKRLDLLTTKLSLLDKPNCYMWITADMTAEKLTWGQISALSLARRPDLILQLAVHILSAAGRGARAKAGDYSNDGFSPGCRNMDELAKAQHLSLASFDTLAPGLSEAILFLNSMLYAIRDERPFDAPEGLALAPVNAALDDLAAALTAYGKRDFLAGL